MQSAPSSLALLEDVRRDINELLAHYLKGEKKKARSIDPAYLALWDAIETLVMTGGKRYRAYLTVLGYQICGGKSYKNILPVAASHELLNVSLLIHDDIIDRDFIRHGQDNVSGTFRKKYLALGLDEPTAVHYAHSAALLAGDALLSAAHQWLMLSRFPDTSRQLAMRIFNTGIFEVTGGELLDTEAALYEPLEANSLAIARYKTAGYSLISPLCVGAVMAGANSTRLRKLEKLGENVGIAYQLTDDLLGLFGEAETIGKSVLSDLREGKRTYTIQETLRRATPRQQKILLELLGKSSADYADLEQMRTIVTQSGARHHTEEKIADYERVAHQIIETMDLPLDSASQLKAFVSKALNRKV